jgi:hypothetical protein
MKIDEGRLLLQREAAIELRCSVKTIQRLRRRGVLACIPGRPVLVSARDVLLYKETQIRRELASENPRAKKRLARDATPAQFSEAAAEKARIRIRRLLLRWRMRVGRTRKPNADG